MTEAYAVKVRPEKAEAVDKIRTELGAAQAAVVTEYRGLTVKDLKTLRSRLLDVDASYRVSKNTLVRIAVNDLGLSDLEGLLEGPVAVAYIRGDPVAAAKVLATFSREHPNLVIKGGLLDGVVLTDEQTRDLATVDPLDTSRAKIAGMLVAPLQRIMMLLEAPAGRILFVLEELAKRGPSEAPAEVEAPAETEAPAEVEAPAETTNEVTDEEGE